MKSPHAISKADFQALAEFRFQLRRFLHFSEDAAKAEGLTPLQYQLLLQVKGLPDDEQASIGRLALRLQLSHHGTVSLVTRCERAGLVVRAEGLLDRRQVEVVLTPMGETAVRRIARRHSSELRSLSEVFQVALLTEFNDEE